MGILRLILATSVFNDHLGALFGFKFLPSALAVQGFFLISGFYMALVLETKYRDRTKLFLINRFTKIYFLYFIVLIASVLVALHFESTMYHSIKRLLRTLEPASLPVKLAIVAPNIMIFGLDALMFFRFSEDATICFSHCVAIQMHNFMLIPQAWSLSLELMFYLIAPFLVRLSSKKLGWLVAIILLARCVSWFLFPVMQISPWSYRFFPFELSTFLLGVLAYRVYRSALFAKFSKYSLNMSLALLGFLIFYRFGITFFDHALNIILLFLFLPFLFHTFMSSKWDRWIGEFSFPLYLCHLLVSQVIYQTPSLKDTPTEVAYLAALMVSAILLIVERPVEKWRTSLTLAS